MSVSFAKDIAPLFTPGDVTCMGRHGVLLKDFAYMSVPANAANVLAHLDGSRPPLMPPGGWPAANIKAFKSWIADGYKP
jgi:hypothetical protein